MPDEGMNIEKIISRNAGVESDLEEAMNTAFFDWAKFVTNQDGNDGRISKDNYGAAAKHWDDQNAGVIKMLGYTVDDPSEATRAAVANALGLVTAPEASQLMAQLNGNLLQSGQQFLQTAIQTNQQNRSRYENQLLSSPEGRDEAKKIVVEGLDKESNLTLKGPAAKVVDQMIADQRFTAFARNYLSPGRNMQTIAGSFKDYMTYNG